MMVSDEWLASELDRMRLDWDSSKTPVFRALLELQGLHQMRCETCKRQGHGWVDSPNGRRCAKWGFRMTGAEACKMSCPWYKEG